MTLEERARALWMETSGDDDSDIPIIVAAFRAIEDDALERAAGRAEAVDQNVADAIRAMKHESN